MLWVIISSQKGRSIRCWSTTAKRTKDFLASPAPSFVDPTASRKSGHWRLFGAERIWEVRGKRSARCAQPSQGWLPPGIEGKIHGTA